MKQHTTKPKPGTRWTDEELAYLRELAADGLTMTAIAYHIRSRHGRSVLSTYGQIARLGGLAAVRGTRVLHTLTQRQVAQLMGRDSHTVRRWIDRGWLEAAHYRRRRKHERRRGPTTLISDVALHAFLAVEEAWPSYAPATIADPDLRAEAERLRAEAGGGWVKVTDLMRAACYAELSGWRYIGAYPGPKRTTMWQSTTYLWAPHAPAFLAWMQCPSSARRAA